jgi:urease accessory protein
VPPAARLVVGLAGGRSVVRESRSGLPLGLRQLHGWAAGAASGAVHVAIVQTGAMLVGGDDVRLEVEVGPGAALVLQDISATLAHPMDGAAGDARQHLNVRVAPGGCAVIAEEPLVVARGARLQREVRIDLDGDARAVHRDTLVLGRHGEAGGNLLARTRVQRDGVPLLDDGLDTSLPTSAAVLGGARVLASLSAFGLPEAVDVPPDAFLLASGDVLLRRLAADVRSLHDVDACLRRWQAAALACGAAPAAEPRGAPAGQRLARSTVRPAHP